MENLVVQFYEVFVMHPERDAFAEEVNELMVRYGLEDGGEYVIIPFTNEQGKRKKIYLLKRRYIRIMHAEDHYVDYPLPEVVEALVNYPEGDLRKVMHLFHKEHAVEEDLAEGRREESGNGGNVNSSGQR